MSKSQSLITAFFYPKQKLLIPDDSSNESSFRTKKKQYISLYNRRLDYIRPCFYKEKFKNSSDRLWMPKGYCFVANCNFTEYRVYTRINRCMGNKMLFESGDCIATATVDADSALEHINVEESLQGTGIGTKLIRFINTCDKQFYVYSGIEHNSRYRLTEQGARLIRACQRKGILKDNQILHDVPSSPRL